MYKDSFPFFKHQENPYHYLDSAATTQKPQSVISAIEDYYLKYNANPHSSAAAQELLDQSRIKTAEFLHAEKQGVVFTKNATEGLNIIAHALSGRLGSQDEILVTELEHHSNFLPWQAIASQTGAKLVIAKTDKFGDLVTDDWLSKLNQKTKIVALSAVSNVTGSANDLNMLIKEAHRKNCLVVIDAAQATGHQLINVHQLDCDFLAFSGHKMYGPLGVGILYIRPEIAKELNPLYLGGGMVGIVSDNNSSWALPPERFEAGTIDSAAVFGLTKAIDFIKSIGIETIIQHESKLINLAKERLSKHPEITLYSSARSKTGQSVLSFNLNSVHPHDLAFVLNQKGIIVRSGDHCAQPLMKALGIPGTVRLSVGIYNEPEDIQSLDGAVSEAIDLFANRKTTFS